MTSLPRYFLMTTLQPTCFGEQRAIGVDIAMQRRATLTVIRGHMRREAGRGGRGALTGLY
ncbi:MAG TPA: hypothetical protein VKD72_18275 [Gemmataceae bacterium]|nr:hypothetical protein [Gemmataceae bacterium]